MKLKPKMLMGIGIPLIIVFIVMGIIIYMMAGSALRDGVDVSMEERGSHYATRLDGNLREEITMMQTIVMNWSEVMPGEEALAQAIDHIAARHGVRTAAFGRPDGSYVASIPLRARALGTRRRVLPTGCISRTSMKNPTRMRMS